MKDLMKNLAYRKGAYVALLNIAYLLYAYLFDTSIFISSWPGLLLFFVGIIFCISSVWSFKKERRDGFITFREAFSAYILTAIVATLIGTAFNVLLFSIIDPEFAVQAMDLIIETTYERFETSGMSDEQIEQIIGRIEGSNAFGVAGQLKSAAFSVMFNSIIAMIVAAAMKKNKPEEFSEMHDMIVGDPHDSSMQNMHPKGTGIFAFDKTNPIPIYGIDNITNYFGNLRYQVKNESGTTMYLGITAERTNEFDSADLGSLKEDEFMASSTTSDNIEGLIDVYNLYSHENTLLARVFLHCYSLKTSNAVPSGFLHVDEIPLSRDSAKLQVLGKVLSRLNDSK